jgi:hypothetical protein
MTVYAHFIERASPTWVTAGGQNPRIVQIGGSANANPRLYLTKTTGADMYRLEHEPTGAGYRASTLDLNPVLGSRVELRAVLNTDGNGSVQLHGALNGGAESSAGASSASFLQAAWSAPALVSIGCIGATGQGDIALRSLKIVAGIHSMDELRAAAP